MTLESNLNQLSLGVDYDEYIACARYGELDDLKALVDASSNMDLTHKDMFGNTALHMAAANGHAEVVAYLLEKCPALLNMKNERLNTPLHWACLNGKTQVVQCLLMAGALPSEKNEAGKTPSYEAQLGDHEEIVKLLIEKFQEEANEQEEQQDEAQ